MLSAAEQTQPVFLRRKEDWFNRHPRILCHPLTGLWHPGLSPVLWPSPCGPVLNLIQPLALRPSLSFWVKAKEVLGGAVPQALWLSLPHSSVQHPDGPLLQEPASPQKHRGSSPFRFLCASPRPRPPQSCFLSTLAAAQ